jgi:hypothetical protein
MLRLALHAFSSAVGWQEAQWRCRNALRRKHLLKLRSQRLQSTKIFKLTRTEPLHPMEAPGGVLATAGMTGQAQSGPQRAAAVMLKASKSRVEIAMGGGKLMDGELALTSIRDGPQVGKALLRSGRMVMPLGILRMPFNRSHSMKMRDVLWR